MRISDWSSDVCSSDLEAQAAVAAASYPPDGFRGLTLTSRANAFGRNPDYLTEGTRQIAIVVQIETRMALENLEAIAAAERSEERRVGKECVRTCRSLWSPHP